MPLKLLYNREEFDIDNKRIYIGRSDTKCDIIITDDDSVSRQHAMISNGQLHDLKSANGTKVNGKPLQMGSKHTLKNKDIIEVGNTRLSVVQGWANLSEDKKQNLNRSKRFGKSGENSSRPDGKEPAKGKSSQKDPEPKAGEKRNQKDAEKATKVEDDKSQETVEDFMSVNSKKSSDTTH